MKLSIITINYNNRDGFQRTIDSVICQTWRDFEWIVIDGGSTDGSKELIEHYQDRFAYWCSESDKGVYNAMNKGIAKAQGEYLNFMNSGDVFANSRIVNDFIRSGWNEDVIAGDVMLDGNVEKIITYPDDSYMDIDFMRRGGLCHQSTFIRRSLFDLYGKYDESFKIVADWKFFFETIILHNCTYRHWPEVLVDYDTNGVSGDTKYAQLHHDERKRVLSCYNRILQSIDKRDQRIQDLDLPVMVILRRKLYAKIKNLFR